MERLVVLMLLVLAGKATAQHGSSGCPTEEDALAVELTEQDFYQTAHFATYEDSLGPYVIKSVNVSADYIQRQQTIGSYAPSGDLQTLIDVESSINYDDADSVAVPYYYSTCPYSWYVIARWRYYYRTITYPKGQVVYMYHWSYYPIWQTRCTTYYCRIRYSPSYWWDYRYRCFPEYRWVNTWMLKLTITYNKNSDGSLTYVKHFWSRVLVKLWLKRGCCCRRYWWFKSITNAQCQAHG